MSIDAGHVIDNTWERCTELLRDEDAHLANRSRLISNTSHGGNDSTSMAARQLARLQVALGGLTEISTEV